MQMQSEPRFVKNNASARFVSGDGMHFEDAEVIITVLPQRKVIREAMPGSRRYALRGQIRYLINLSVSPASPPVRGLSTVQGLSLTDDRPRYLNP